jgi:hypothetical protein
MPCSGPRESVADGLLSPSRENVFRKVVIWAAGAVLTLLAVSVVAYRMLFPTLPVPVRPSETVWLDQGWTSDQREQYYRTPQGSLIMPYSWFLALERPEAGNHEPFSAEESLVRYNLVPGPDTKHNPDRLPVGLTMQSIPDEYYRQLGCGAPPCPDGSSLHSEWLSYTCAACHVARINYRGRSIGIDGGRGRWNFTVFNRTLANLLLVTATVPTIFDRFASKVFRIEKRKDGPDERARLRKELREFLRNPKIVDGVVGSIKHTYPTEEGYGRVDAFGRGANGEFGPLDKRNVQRANAPVLIPPLWYVHDYGWVQSISAIHQPLGRNIAESWGVSAAVDLLNPNPAKLFASTILLEHMFWMETLISVMTPPAWPERIFGKVDREAAQLGRYLYEEKVFDGALSPAEEQWCPESPAGPANPANLANSDEQPCPNPERPTKGLCARCHAPVAEVHANEFGKRYWQLPLYKLNVIGTDPQDALNFNARQIYTGNLRVQFGGREKVSFAEALQTATSGVMAHEFENQEVSREDRPDFSGHRRNGFRAPLAYAARPLQGYWATPPYLHDGAVPNLYELLSPADERSPTFWTGDMEFDPVKVGYRAAQFVGGFEFVTKRSFIGAAGYSLRELLAGRLEFKREVDGNSNLGHEFRNAPKGTKGVVGPYLTPKERLAIIEYMKVMPDVKPPDGGDELRRRQALLQQMEQEYEGASSSDRNAVTNSLR